MNNSQDKSGFNFSGSITIGDVNYSKVGIGANINQNDELKPEKIEDLLAQLKEEIKKEPRLDDEKRKEALNQIQILETANNNPHDEKTKNKALNAHGMLQHMIEVLPPVSAVLNIGKTVLPAIAKLLGFN